MRKNNRGLAIILCMLVIAVLVTSLVACKPGYKETWDKIAPYSFNWDKDNGDIALITSRINVDVVNEKKAERKKIDEENAKKQENGEEVKPNPLDPAYLLSCAKEDGTFSNIDYNSDSKTYWAPLDHLKHVLHLQVAYNTEGDEFYKSEQIKNVVSKAMKHWAEKDYKCDWNWWYNDVGVGMYLPNILLLGVEGLSEDETNAMLSSYEKTLLHTQPMRFRLYERKCNQAGGNLTDQALATLKFCCITNDGNTIMWIKEQIENELRFFPDWDPKHHRWDAEGVKEDYSFQQHDQLIYFGGYGEVFMDGLATYLGYTKDTQFALSSEKLDFLTTFLMEGVQFSTRGGYRDISASGRGISRGPKALKGIYTQLKRCVDAILEYDTISEESRNSLTNFVNTRTPEADKGAGGHRYFYKSDYNVMNSEKYMATVRHASKMTRVFEVLNGENAKGYWTGFGATFYYVDGDEYDETLISYNWSKIPGTTVKQGKVPQVKEWYSYDRYGKTAVSGVSNKKVGVSHLNMSDKGVRAKKAYFMFEDGVVCLGNDIDSFNLAETYTTINQVRKDGDVIIVSGANQEVANLGTTKTLKADFIFHDKIAYFSNNELSLSVNNQSGDVKDLNLRQKNSDIVKQDIFELGISHGKMPNNKKYEYTTLMNTTVEEAKAYKANPYLKVVANDKKAQAVEDTKNNVAQIVFHKGAKVNVLGTEVKVNKACVMIIEKVGDKFVLTISNYDTVKDDDVKVTINGKTVELTTTQKPQTKEF